MSVSPNAGPDKSSTDRPHGTTIWDILLAFIKSRSGRIAALIVVGALIFTIATGWLRFSYGSDGVRVLLGRAASREEMERFVGRWTWKGRNLVDGKPYQYAGTLNLHVSGDHIEGEGEYRITAGPPKEPPPRSITVVGRIDEGYLNINYEVRSIGVPGSRGFGFMLLYAAPNGTTMKGHFLTRSLLEDGIVWGELEFSK